MTPRRLLAIRLSGGVAIAAVVWVLVLVIGGGFDTLLFGVRIRSNDPAKPRVLAELAFLVFAWLRGFGQTTADVAWIGKRILRACLRVRTLAVCALAGGVFILGVVKLAPFAGGSDSYGYVSQVDLWLSGHPIIEQPWTDNVPWPNAQKTFTPIAYMAVPSRNAIVPTYSPGLPFIMALVHLVAGYRAMFLVEPISGAILVMATYGLGRRLGSANLGVMAAWLVATSPVVLAFMIQPMSDVPAAAGWALAFYLLFGRHVGSAVGAGLTAGIATLIHPNHVPSAVVMGAWLVFKLWRDAPHRSLHVRRTVGFLAGYLPCLATVAGVYWWLYGSPVRSGYGPLGQYYDASHILPNLHSYLSWLAESQTPLAYVGLLAIVLPLRRLWPDAPDRSMVVALGALVTTLWAQYMSFQLLGSWVYLRYVMASLPAIMLGVGSVGLLAVRWAGNRVIPVIAAVVIGVGLWTFSFAMRTGGLNARLGEYKYAATAQLVRARSDDASVVLAGLYSGSVRYYGGRMTLRPGALDGNWLDRTVEWLTLRGHRVYALLEEEEVGPFVDDFAGQQHAQLAGRLVFVYRATSNVFFYDLSRPADQPLKPEYLLETYTGPVYFPPAALNFQLR